jgi:hypothetical protein
VLPETTQASGQAWPTTYYDQSIQASKGQPVLLFLARNKDNTGLYHFLQDNLEECDDKDKNDDEQEHEGLDEDED